MKTLTLEQLIEAAEICGSGKEGACQVCPAHNDGEVMSSACIESVMTQAAAALKEYAASAWNLRTKEPNFQYGGCENENQKNHKPV